jgi:hypothetical protein
MEINFHLRNNRISNQINQQLQNLTTKSQKPINQRQPMNLQSQQMKTQGRPILQSRPTNRPTNRPPITIQKTKPKKIKKRNHDQKKKKTTQVQKFQFFLLRFFVEKEIKINERPKCKLNLRKEEIPLFLLMRQPRGPDNTLGIPFVVCWFLKFS